MAPNYEILGIDPSTNTLFLIGPTNETLSLYIGRPYESKSSAINNRKMQLLHWEKESYIALQIWQCPLKENHIQIITK